MSSSRDTKITRKLLESGPGLLAKKYEKNPSYGRTGTHDDMVPWLALGTKMNSDQYINSKIKILQKRLSSANLRDVAMLESVQSRI